MILVRRLGAVLILCGLGVACGGIERGTALPPPPRELATSTTSLPEYTIGPLDSVRVHIIGMPDLSTSVTVRPDGLISLPLVGDLPAAGKSPSQLARDLEATLQRYVQQPSATVVVERFANSSPYMIRVTGAVPTPTSVVFYPGMTVLDAVAAAGGLGDLADGNQAMLVRRQLDGDKVYYRLRLDDLLDGGDASADAPVQAGDIIVIPEIPQPVQF